MSSSSSQSSSEGRRFESGPSGNQFSNNNNEHDRPVNEVYLDQAGQLPHHGRVAEIGPRPVPRHLFEDGPDLNGIFSDLDDLVEFCDRHEGEFEPGRPVNAYPLTDARFAGKGVRLAFDLSQGLPPGAVITTMREIDDDTVPGGRCNLMDLVKESPKRYELSVTGTQVLCERVNQLLGLEITMQSLYRREPLCFHSQPDVFVECGIDCGSNPDLPPPSVMPHDISLVINFYLFRHRCLVVPNYRVDNEHKLYRLHSVSCFGMDNDGGAFALSDEESEYDRNRHTRKIFEEKKEVLSIVMLQAHSWLRPTPSYEVNHQIAYRYKNYVDLYPDSLPLGQPIFFDHNTIRMFSLSCWQPPLARDEAVSVIDLIDDPTYTSARLPPEYIKRPIMTEEGLQMYQTARFAIMDGELVEGFCYTDLAYCRFARARLMQYSPIVNLAEFLLSEEFLREYKAGEICESFSLSWEGDKSGVLHLVGEDERDGVDQFTVSEVLKDLLLYGRHGKYACFWHVYVGMKKINGRKRPVYYLAHVLFVLSLLMMAVELAELVARDHCHTLFFAALLISSHCSMVSSIGVIGLMNLPLAEAVTPVRQNSMSDYAWMLLMALFANLLVTLFPKLKKFLPVEDDQGDIESVPVLKKRDDWRAPKDSPFVKPRRRYSDDGLKFQSLDDFPQPPQGNRWLRYLRWYAIYAVTVNVVFWGIELGRFLYVLCRFTVWSHRKEQSDLKIKMATLTTGGWGDIGYMIAQVYWRYFYVIAQPMRRLLVYTTTGLGIPWRYLNLSGEEIKHLLWSKKKKMAAIAKKKAVEVPGNLAKATIAVLSSPVNDIAGFFLRWFSASAGDGSMFRTSVLAHDFASVAARVFKQFGKTKSNSLLAIVGGLCGFVFQEGEESADSAEVSKSWFERIAAYLKTWSKLSQKTKNTIGAFLSLLPLAPMVSAGCDVNDMRETGLSVMNRLQSLASLDRVFKSLMDFTSSVVTALGYGKIGVQLLKLANPRGKDAEYDEFVTWVSAVMEGEKINMSRMYNRADELKEYYEKETLEPSPFDRDRGLSRLANLRKLRSDLLSYERTCSKRQRAVCTAIRGEVQIGKTTLLKYLADCQASWMGDVARVGKVLESSKFPGDTLRNYHNIAEYDDAGSLFLKDEQGPLDILRRDVNVDNAPLEASRIEDKGNVYPKHKAYNVTMNSWNLVRNEVTPEAGLARIDFAYEVKPDMSRSVKSGNAYIPKEEERTLKHRPTHVLFRKMKLSAFNGTVNATPVGDWMSFEEWIKTYSVEWKAKEAEYRRNFEGSTQLSDEMCQHDNYLVNCKECLTAKGMDPLESTKTVPVCVTVTEEDSHQSLSDHIFGYVNGGLPGVFTVMLIQGTCLHYLLILDDGYWFFLHWCCSQTFMVAACLTSGIEIYVFLFLWFLLRLVQLRLRSYSSLMDMSAAQTEYLLSGTCKLAKYTVAGASSYYLLRAIKKYRDELNLSFQNCDEPGEGTKVLTVTKAEELEKLKIERDNPGMMVPEWKQPELVTSVQPFYSSGIDFETLRVMVSKAQWRIIGVSGKTISFATVMNSGEILMNAHTFHKLRKLGFSHFERDPIVSPGDFIKKDFPDHWYRRKVVLDYDDSFVDDSRDTAVVAVWSGLPDAPDISKYIVAEIGSDTSEGILLGNSWACTATMSGCVKSRVLGDLRLTHLRDTMTTLANYDGLCGALYLSRKDRCIIGMHSLGSGNHSGKATVFTYNDYQKWRSSLRRRRPTKVPPMLNEYGLKKRIGSEDVRGIHRFLSGITALPLVESFVARRGPAVSELEDNPYFPKLAKHLPKMLETKGFVAPVLKHANKVYRPHAIMGCSQYGEMDIQLCKETIQEIIEDSRMVREPSANLPRRPLTLHEVLNGLYGRNPRMAASVGFPNGGPKSKWVEWVNGYYSLKPEYQLLYDKALIWLRTGHGTGTVGNACLKDEPLPESKVVLSLGGAPARVFVIDSFVFYILCKQFLGTTLEYLGDNPDEFEHLIGIDPLGKEWEEYAKSFDCCVPDKNVLGDYAKYDFEHCDSSNNCTVDFTEEIVKNRFKYTDEDTQIAKCLAHECCRRCINYDGVIMSSPNSWSSGNLMTGMFGSLKNRFWFRAVFRKLNPGLRFRDHVKLRVLGDDNHSKIIQGSEALWDPQRICDTMAEFGMVLTPETKDGAMRYSSDEETEILKRRTVFQPDLNYRVGRLQLDSLYRGWKMWKKPDNPRQQFIEMIPNTLRDLVAHGREVYEEHLTAFKTVASEEDIALPAYATRDYDTMVSEILGKGDPDSPQQYVFQANDDSAAGTLPADSGTNTQVEQVQVTDVSLEREARSYSDGTTLRSTHDRHSMPSMVDREVPMGEHLIQMHTYNPVGDWYPLETLLSDPFIGNRLVNFHACSFDLRIRFALSATRFHAGRVLISVLHHHDELDVHNETSLQFSFRNVYGKSRQNLELEVAEDGGGEFIVPFLEPRGKMLISKIEARRYLRLTMTVLNPVTHREVGAAPPRVNMYVSFRNLNVIGNVSYNFQSNLTPPEPQASPSVLLGRIASAADVVRNIPALAVPAQIVSGLSTQAASLMRALGHSKPLRKGDPYIPMSTLGTSNANSDATGHIVSFDARQSVSCDPRIGTDRGDNMSYGFFSSTPAPFAYGKIDSGESVGTKLFSMSVTPMIAVKVGQNVMPLPCAVPAMINGFWRCTMVYTFVFTVPPTASMRLRFYYEAADGASVSHVVNDNQTIDVRSVKRFTMRIGFFAVDNFLKTKNFSFANDGVFWNDMHNGVIQMVPESTLVGVEPPNALYYYVEAHAENFLYGNPTYDILESYTPLDMYSRGTIETRIFDPHPLSPTSGRSPDVPSNTEAPGETLPPGTSYPVTNAPTPSLGDESESIAPSTSAPTSRPTFAHTTPPTVSPTIRETLPPTAAPTSEWKRISLLPELWGSGLSSYFSDLNPVKLTAGNDNMTFYVHDFPGQPTATIYYTGKTDSLPRTSEFEYIPEARGLDVFSRLGGAIVRRLEISVPRWFNQYELPFDQWEPLLITGSWSDDVDLGIAVKVFNEDSTIEIDVPQARDNSALGLIFQGLNIVDRDTGETLGRDSSAPAWMANRRHGRVIPGYGKKRYKFPAGTKLHGVAWIEEDMKFQAADESLTAEMSVEAPELDHSDLMKVHVGEWNQSVLTHLKVPIYRREYVTPPGSRNSWTRRLYEVEDFVVPSNPVALLLGMYGGFRGGIVSHFFSHNPNVTLMADRGKGSRTSPTAITPNYHQRGVEMHHTSVNPYACFHFPFISRFRFLFGKSSSQLIEDNHRRLTVVNPTSEPATVEEYFSLGEDFTPIYFTGPPLLRSA